MRRSLFLAVISCLLLASPTNRCAGAADENNWKHDFDVNRESLKSTGRNDYFILEPGDTLVLEGKGEKLTVRVLDETKKVDGVETRVVEEHETKNGKVVEISRNYFAIDLKTRDVYYFGEEVDNYKDGKVADHEGSWLAGKNGAKFGLMMPGKPRVHDRYFQELAPKEAMDRAEVVSLDETIEGLGHKYEHCLKTEETTPLEPKERENKYYAAGVGLVREAGMTLVSHTEAVKKSK